MRGIVKVPVVAVLATALPESDPINPLATTETFPGAPLLAREQAAGQLKNERRHARQLQESSEDDKQKDIGKHDPQCDPEDSLAVQEDLRNHAAQSVAPMGQ